MNKNFFEDPNSVDLAAMKGSVKRSGVRNSALEVIIEDEAGEKTSCVQNMTPFVLLIGLGAHALFEGIACGMCDTLEKTTLFVTAIAMHKGAAGMSLGIAFAKAFPGRDNFVMCLLATFAIFTPIGVSIGLILQAASDIAELVMNCLAAGTFIYIACSEVIIEEFSMPDHKMLKLLFFLIGIALIACLKFVDPG